MTKKERILKRPFSCFIARLVFDSSTVQCDAMRKPPGDVLIPNKVRGSSPRASTPLCSVLHSAELHCTSLLCRCCYFGAVLCSVVHYFSTLDDTVSSVILSEHGSVLHYTSHNICAAALIKLTEVADHASFNLVGVLLLYRMTSGSL